MMVVFEPSVQSVPKMVLGPTKKKMVAARKTSRKTMTPMPKRAIRQVPLFYFLEIRFMAPERPATPSSRKTMEQV
jgi:hypothetical protein